MNESTPGIGRNDGIAASVLRKWDVQFATTETNWYEGIEAESAEQAIAKFYEGEGEINPERTTHSPGHIDAEPSRV